MRKNVTTEVLLSIIEDKNISVPSHPYSGWLVDSIIETMVQQFAETQATVRPPSFLHILHLSVEEEVETRLKASEVLNDINDSEIVRFAAFLYSNLVQKSDFVKDSEDNYLNAQQSLTLNDGEKLYREAMAKVITEKGLLMQYNPSVYGWMSYHDDVPSAANLTPVAVRNCVEDMWDEFNGTFEEDSIRHGLTAEVVFSDCVPRFMRWEGSLSTLMHTLRTQ